MSLKYPELFKPFQIGKVEIKNRIVMIPMLTGGWFEADAKKSLLPGASMIMSAIYIMRKGENMR